MIKDAWNYSILFPAIRNLYLLIDRQYSKYEPGNEYATGFSVRSFSRTGEKQMWFVQNIHQQRQLRL